MRDNDAPPRPAPDDPRAPVEKPAGEKARVPRGFRESPEEMRHLIRELEVHQIELETQNEELNRARAELEASRTRYFDLYDFAPVGYLTVDGQGMIVEANLTAAGMVGMSREELIRQPLARLLVPEHREACRLHIGELFEKRAPQVFETLMRRRDADVIWVRLEAVAAQREDGATVCLAVVSDISDRKREKERAAEAERRFLQCRQLEIAALLKSARAVLGHREFPKAARVIFDACKELIGAAAGYVALLSHDGAENDVVFLDSGGLSCSVDPSLPMPIRGLREEVYRTRGAVFDNDFAGSQWMAFMPEGHARLENVLFAPLVIEKKTVGLLGLANKPGGFTNHDADVVSAFGRHAAISLVNSRTFAALKSSREHFRSLVESATDAIVSADGNGIITDWNQAASRMFGYAADQALGKSVTMLMPEEFRNRHSAGMLRLGVSGESRIAGHTLEMTGLRADGAEFPIELSLARWETAEGVHFTGIIRDCTERKQAQRRILESEERYRAIVETSRDLIFFFDAEGRLRWQNPAAQNFLGAPPEGLDIFSRVHADDAARVAAAWRAVREAEGGGDKVIARYRAADGGYRTLEGTTRKISLGGETLWCATATDITERVKLRGKIAGHEGIAGIVGHDPKMLELFASVAELAEVDIPVLILGESGTGKELVASAIHREGPRAARNFVTINCGSIPDTLLETELFGHVKGSFTGAHRDKRGRFEIADRGTIFLDEVGDLSLAMQVKLLRVLQEGTFERVGAEKSTRVNVRLISATNKDLTREVAASRFREDLFYRLSAVPLTIPPLRERLSDLPLLVEHIIAEESSQSDRRRDSTRPPRKITVSLEALSRLAAHHWPGNVRELQNVLRFAIIKCKGNVLRPEHLPKTLAHSAHDNPAVRGRKPKLTADSAIQALKQAGGRPAEAARLLGVSRATLYRHLPKV